MTAPITHDEWGTVIWTCHPRGLACPQGHLVRFGHDFHRDHRWLNGHDFLRCEKCRPASHYFAVFSTQPDLHTTCYLITEQCWREWVKAPDSAMLPTREMLYLIRDPAGRNYNPHFNPDFRP